MICYFSSNNKNTISSNNVYNSILFSYSWSKYIFYYYNNFYSIVSLSGIVVFAINLSIFKSLIFLIIKMYLFCIKINFLHYLCQQFIVCFLYIYWKVLRIILLSLIWWLHTVKHCEIPIYILLCYIFIRFSLIIINYLNYYLENL